MPVPSRELLLQNDGDHDVIENDFAQSSGNNDSGAATGKDRNDNNTNDTDDSSDDDGDEQHPGIGRGGVTGWAEVRVAVFILMTYFAENIVANAPVQTLHIVCLAALSN